MVRPDHSRYQLLLRMKISFLEVVKVKISSLIVLTMRPDLVCILALLHSLFYMF